MAGKFDDIKREAARFAILDTGHGAQEKQDMDTYVLVLVDDDCAPRVYGPLSSRQDAQKIADEDGLLPDEYHIVPLQNHHLTRRKDL